MVKKKEMKQKWKEKKGKVLERHIIYIHKNKDKINKKSKKKKELLSLDRPGRLTDATRGNIMKGKKKKKNRKRKKKYEEHRHTDTYTRYTHTCSETKKRNTTKMEHFYIHDVCASA